MCVLIYSNFMTLIRSSCGGYRVPEPENVKKKRWDYRKARNRDGKLWHETGSGREWYLRWTVCSTSAGYLGNWSYTKLPGSSLGMCSVLFQVLPCSTCTESSPSFMMQASLLLQFTNRRGEQSRQRHSEDCPQSLAPHLLCATGSLTNGIPPGLGLFDEFSWIHFLY